MNQKQVKLFNLLKDLDFWILNERNKAISFDKINNDVMFYHYFAIVKSKDM